MNTFESYFTLRLPRCENCNVLIGLKQGKYCDECKKELKNKENKND